MMGNSPSNLSILLTVRDMSDEEAGVDDVLFGCALDKDRLSQFLADAAELVHSHGGKTFEELADSDDDAPLANARKRRLLDASDNSSLDGR